MPSVNTPIHVNKLKIYLKKHPDRQFVHYLITGLTQGFDTGIKNLPDTSLECKNLLSATSQKEVVSDLIQQELDKGFLAGPYQESPYPIHRINPIGIAESKYSKKKRLIVDMSAPHNDVENSSLNDLIDKDQFSLNYVTIDNAINLLKKYGRNSLMCKTDISDAFKLIPIKPELWPFHGIKWNNQYYFFTRLVFGSRSSPKIFDTLSQAICWIAEKEFRINSIIHLLDDFLTVDPPDYLADRTMSLLTYIFASLGIPLSAKKTVGPTKCLEYLGIILDSEKMEARLPQDKLARICEMLMSFKSKKSCTKKELLSLLGHLNFACRVIHPGRSFISYLISLSCSVKELHHHIKLTEACRLDLCMWLKFLSHWNGISFFLNDQITKAAKIKLFTDATDKTFGGIYGNKWFQGHFPSEILSSLDPKDKLSMAFNELYPIVMALLLWGHQWKRKRLLFYCDNLATVNIINKGRSKSKMIMNLMRKLTFCSAVNNVTLHAEHIPGKTNTIADAISRLQMQRFRRLAPNAEALPTPCLPASDLLMC